MTAVEHASPGGCEEPQAIGTNGAPAVPGPLRTASDSEAFRGGGESFVACPKRGARREARGGDELGVDVSDAEALERLSLDEGKDFVGGGQVGLREATEQCQDFPALGEIPEGELAGDPRVAKNAALLQVSGEAATTGPEVVDPRGSVNEDHLRCRATARWGARGWLGSRESGEASSTLLLDECREGLPDKGGLLDGAGQSLCLGKKLVVESKCGAHSEPPSTFRDII